MKEIEKRRNYKQVERTLSGIIIATLIICLPDRTHLAVILGILISRGLV